MKTRNMKRIAYRILTVITVISMMLGMMVFASAAPTANQQVNDAKNGVVQVQLWFVDPEFLSQGISLGFGSGFLINSNTIVTCAHVVTGFPDSFYQNWALETNQILGANRTAAQIKEGLELRVSVLRDLYIKAKVTQYSLEMDYAILTLDQPIQNRTPLSLRDSDTLQQTEAVFSLGFPGDLVDVNSTNYYDTDDVVITSGNVNSVKDMTFTATGALIDINYKNVNMVEHSAIITGGNSGGPLVDNSGYIVGINSAGDDTRNFAVSTKNLISVLDALGIKYTKAGAAVTPNTQPADTTPGTPADTTPAPADNSKLSSLISKAEGKDAENYTEKSYKALEDALKNAKAALNSGSQTTIDNAYNELDSAISGLKKVDDKSDESSSMLTIIIIAVVAVIVVVLVIVLVIALGGKKKAAPAPAAAPIAPPAPPAAPAYNPPAPPAAPAYNPPAPSAAPAFTPVAPRGGAAETTVLSQNSNETTVLSAQANGGVLTRTSTGERISINAADFAIGRERSSVNYCISDNSNISRVHVRFVVRGAATYLIDNKAANGTFVNGIKALPGKELELKSGDKILLADEKFEFSK